MPGKDVVQERSVYFRLFEHLVDAGEVFVSPDTRRDRNDVLGPKNFCGDAFVFDWLRVTHCFFGQSGRSEKLDREIVDQQMFAFDAPTFGLEMRIDRGDSGA